MRKQLRNGRERGLHERVAKQDGGIKCRLQYAPLPMLDEDENPVTVQWPFCAPDDLEALPK